VTSRAPSGDQPARYPRRDTDGRIIDRWELLAAVGGGLVVTFAAVALIDGAVALISSGRFGQLPGGLIGVLPLMLFVDEFRAWRGTPRRAPVALLCGLLASVLAIGTGLTVAGLAPPLVSGAVGAAVGAVVYAALWFVGVRWAASSRGVSR
jgi:hypothetical protein